MTEDQMRELWYKAGGDIYKYADLVADKEREACAKIADKWSLRADDVGGYIGEDIRARGQE